LHQTYLAELVGREDVGDNRLDADLTG
jgi:hypothetical protein